MISIRKGPSKKVATAVKQLEKIKREIKRHPTPIAGCDEQFTFLLSERDRLTLELTAIRHYFGD